MTSVANGVMDPLALGGDSGFADAGVPPKRADKLEALSDAGKVE